MKIIFWSDYACPYCYIGEARLKKAVSQMGLGDSVQYEPRAFELDPAASKTVESDTISRFSRKYRMPLPQAAETVEHISTLGREEGLDFRYATTQYTNTFDAHRLMKLALSKNDPSLADKINTMLFDAYFTRNLRLADADVLIDVGKSAGLAEGEIREMLNSDLFADEVRNDERQAAERGIHGVPFFLFENGLTIPGATSVEDFRRALASQGIAGSSGISAHQCGPDGCQL